MITTKDVLGYVYPKHAYNGTVAINNAHHDIVMSLTLLLWQTKEEREGSSLVFTTPLSHTLSFSLYCMNMMNLSSTKIISDPASIFLPRLVLYHRNSYLTNESSILISK